MFWRSNVYIFYFDQFYKPPSNVNIVHETPAQHINIVQAIKNRDPDKARSIMKEHIYTAYAKLSIQNNIGIV